MSTTTIRFRVRNKGGALAGAILVHEVATFDWENFKNVANAEAFVKKSYYAAAQKLVRELKEEKNQTHVHHLQSMESLLARSLNFTKDEIADWCESRDWSRAKFQVKDSSRAIDYLKTNLPALASSEFAVKDELRQRAAEIVADVADSKADPVADYLFAKLSQHQTDDWLEPL